MAFDFISNREYKLYKNTFLQRVLVKFDFNPIDSKNEKAINIKWIQYVGNNFNKLHPTSCFCDRTVKISRNDGLCSFIYNRSSITAIIGAKNYRSFIDDVIPIIYKMKVFLKTVVEVDRVNSITVRKINIWQFNANKKQNVVANEVSKSIFSKDFLKTKSTEIKDENEKKIQNFRRYEWKEGDRECIARTVFYPKNENGNVIQILDTEAITLKTILFNDIEEETQCLNNILYEFYFWSVNDAIVKFMEG